MGMSGRRHEAKPMITINMATGEMQLLLIPETRCSESLSQMDDTEIDLRFDWLLNASVLMSACLCVWECMGVCVCVWYGNKMAALANTWLGP